MTDAERVIVISAFLASIDVLAEEHLLSLTPDTEIAKCAEKDSGY